MIDFVKISDNWNADPVSPEIELKVIGQNLEMIIFLKLFLHLTTIQKATKQLLLFKIVQSIL
jgi:hypothetical protein